MKRMKHAIAVAVLLSLATPAVSMPLSQWKLLSREAKTYIAVGLIHGVFASQAYVLNEYPSPPRTDVGQEPVTDLSELPRESDPDYTPPESSSAQTYQRDWVRFARTIDSLVTDGDSASPADVIEILDRYAEDPRWQDAPLDVVLYEIWRNGNDVTKTMPQR